MNKFAPAKNKILFANFPGDGHFNPLTGLAMHLISLGYDVRWYTSKGFAAKLKKLQIPHYPFEKAIDVSDGNFDAVFPGRKNQHSAIAKLKFDIVHAFVLRAPEYYEDLCKIHREFPFNLVVSDCAFTAIPFIKERMGIPVIAVGVFPLTASSVDLPPVGLGMEPSYTVAGKIKQAVLRGFTNRVLFKGPNRVMHRMLEDNGIKHHNESVFDLLLKKCDVLLQSGTPGFEYRRSDMPKHVYFAGPMLPFTTAKSDTQWFDERLNRYKKVIVVTQGTVEKDINKILVPTLEAFKESDTLVVCTTGGSQTETLRQRYPQANIIIEDFIPFNDVMPYADAYITNGGFGGVLLGIEHYLPLIVAGVHEGKNEICARIGYFKLGINLKTEKPLPRQLKNAVEEVLTNPVYRVNVAALAKEFSEYQPNDLCAAHVARLLKQSHVRSSISKLIADKVY